MSHQYLQIKANLIIPVNSVFWEEDNKVYVLVPGFTESFILEGSEALMLWQVLKGPQLQTNTLTLNIEEQYYKLQEINNLGFKEDQNIESLTPQVESIQIPVVAEKRKPGRPSLKLELKPRIDLSKVEKRIKG